MEDKKSILFISNMYPNQQFPSFGTFVAENERQLRDIGKFNIINVCLKKKKGGKATKIWQYVKFIFNALISLYFSKYDYIYVHYLTHSTLPLLLYPFNKKIIINIHGDDLVGSSVSHKLFQMTNNYFLKRASLIVLPSSYFQKKLMLRYPNLNINKTHINFSGGLNVEEMKLPTTIKGKRKKNIVGYVSRIEEGKLWEIYLESIKNNIELSKELDVEYWFYGAGKELDKFKSEISKDDYCGKVIYKGVFSKEQKAEIFSNFTHFVFPTSRESLGLVLLESLSSGCITLCSDIEPLNSICQGGAIYSDNTVEDFTNKLKELLKLDNYQIRKMENIIRDGIKDYDSEILAKRLVSEIKAL